MQKIMFVYPNTIFVDFIKNFLSRHDYEVEGMVEGNGLMTNINKIYPDLVIVSQRSPNFELRPFLYKRKISAFLNSIPIFLIGDFSPDDLKEFKDKNVGAFISSPINPYALLERINVQFKHSDNIPAKRQTPMLVDIHVKGRIFIVQIEANLEADKIDLINYKIRSYCSQKKIAEPKIFFIIPSIYPETITRENVELLFSTMMCREFDINTKHFKLLTKSEPLIKTLSQSESLSEVEVVPDYLTGMQKLNVDFNSMKKVPVAYLQKDAVYILDLYDEEGEIRIPKMSKITEGMIEYFMRSGLKHLVYYSDKSLAELLKSAGEADPAAGGELDEIQNIINSCEGVESAADLSESRDEKMMLFFNKIRGYNTLVVSEKNDDTASIKKSLGFSLNVDSVESGREVMEVLAKKKYILVFIDIGLTDPDPFKLLSEIRRVYSRRQVTVIVTASKMDAVTLNRLKVMGTDYVVLPPFNKSRMMVKVFEFISADRKK